MEQENNLEHNNKENQVTEGKATVRLSNDEKTFSAFYNPAQELNRDISVIMINTFFKFNKYRKPREIKQIQQNKFSICECLSATGLRAIRYYLELDANYVGEIVANDMDKKAVDCIYKNAERNQVDKEKFKVYQSEASRLLYSNINKFDVVDLDPYGSAIPMLDAAIQSLKSGGLLLATFTDMPVLCGIYPETTFYKYGSIPYKTSFCHEMAMRIALYSISTAASKYQKSIIPLFSFNAEFYIRLVLIVKDSAADCKNNGLKYGYMCHCRNCQNRYITPLGSYVEMQSHKNKEKINSYFRFNNLTGYSTCDVCESNMCLSGPFWIDSLHNEEFLNLALEDLSGENYKYLKYSQNVKNFINAIKGELPLEKQVFNFDYAQFARELGVNCPKLSLFKGALESLNYNFAQSYYDPNLFKTNASASVIYDIFKRYKKDYNGADYLKNIKEDTYKYKILEKEIKVDPVFVESKEKNSNKYFTNPFDNWGPQAKAKEITSESDNKKKQKKEKKKNVKIEKKAENK